MGDLDGGEPTRPLDELMKKTKTKSRARPVQTKETKTMADPKVDTSAAASVAGVDAGEHRTTGSDAETSHDQARTTRDRGFDTQMTRENADINIEEQAAAHGMQQSHAWDANSKRTYDWHQTLDADSLFSSRAHQQSLWNMELRSAEQTLSERQQDHAQRVRFADANSSVQIALLADMAEKLGEVHGMVCKKE